MKTTTDNTKAALFRAAASALIAALCGCAQPTSSGSRNTTENATTIEVGVTSGASTLAEAIAMANGGTAASYTIIINGDNTLPPTTLGPTLSASSARLNLAGPLFADSGVTRTIALQAKDSTGAGAAVALRLAEGEAGSVFTVKAGAALKLGKGVKIADAAGNTAPLLTVAGELDMKAGGALAAVSGNTALHLTGKLNIAGESVIEGKVYDAGELTIGGSALIKGELYIAPDHAVKIDGTLTPAANPQANGMTTAVTSIVAPVREGATATVPDGLSDNVTKPTYKAVASISLTRSALTLAEGETETLIETVLPTDATNKTVVWTTSNPAAATVKAGLVTWKGAGTATITATADGVSTSCTVTCEASSAPPEAPASVNFVLAYAPDTSKTTDKVRLVFSGAVTLAVDSVTITDTDSTGAEPGLIAKYGNDGLIYELAISGVEKSGKINIKVESAGVETAEQEAQVYFVDRTPPPAGVQFVAAYAFDPSKTTEKVRLVFNEVLELTADDITIEETETDEDKKTGAVRGVIAKYGNDGLIYELAISGVKKTGTINIKVEIDGTEISPAEGRDVDIYYVTVMDASDIFAAALAGTASDIEVTVPVQTQMWQTLAAGRTITISGDGLLTIAEDFTALGSIVVENSGAGKGITIANGKTLTLTADAEFKGGETAGVKLGGVLKADGIDSNLYATKTVTGSVTTMEIGVSGSLRSSDADGNGSISLDSGAIKLAAGKTITLGSSGNQIELRHGTSTSTYTATTGTTTAKKVTLSFSAAKKTLTVDGSGARLVLAASNNELMNFTTGYGLVLKNGTAIEAPATSNYGGLNFNGTPAQGLTFALMRAAGGDAIITATNEGARVSGSAADTILWMSGSFWLTQGRVLEFPNATASAFPLTIRFSDSGDYGYLTTANTTQYGDIKADGNTARITATTVPAGGPYVFGGNNIGGTGGKMSITADDGGTLTISVRGYNAFGGATTYTTVGSIDLGGTYEAPVGRIILKKVSPYVNLQISNGAVISTGNDEAEDGEYLFVREDLTVGEKIVIKGDADGSDGYLSKITASAATGNVISLSSSSDSDFEISAATEVSVVQYVVDASSSEAFADALAGSVPEIVVNAPVQTASEQTLAGGRKITINEDGRLIVAEDFIANGNIVVENSGTDTGITIKSGKTLTLGTDAAAEFRGSAAAGVKLGGVLKADGADSNLLANADGTEIGVSGSLRSSDADGNGRISLENGSLRLAAAKTIKLGDSGSEIELLRGTGASLYTALAGTGTAKKVTLSFDATSKTLTANGNGALLRLRASGASSENEMMASYSPNTYNISNNLPEVWAKMNFPQGYKLEIKDGTALEAAGNATLDGSDYFGAFNFNNGIPNMTTSIFYGMMFNKARAAGGNVTITAVADGAEVSGSGANTVLWMGGDIFLYLQKSLRFPAGANVKINMANGTTSADCYWDITASGASALKATDYTRHLTSNIYANTDVNALRCRFSYDSIGNYASSQITGGLTISVRKHAGTKTPIGSIDLGGSGTATAGKIMIMGGSPAVVIGPERGPSANVSTDVPAVIKTGNTASASVYSFAGTNTPTVSANITIKGSAENKLAELARATGSPTITGNAATGTNFEISSNTAVEVVTP